MRLVPGEKTSTIARVLEDPKSTDVGNRRLRIAKISDAETIVNLVAWDSQTERWRYKKGDLLEIHKAFYPENKQPPMLEILKETEIKRIDLPFPEVEECMRKRFLDEAGEEYVIAEGFIAQVYSIESIYCAGCGKYSEGACGCESEKKKVKRVQGIFSDGTETLQFTTVSERVAGELEKALMDKAHMIMGYISEGRLYIEEVLI